MGHRQQMTSKQRIEWDSMQYKAALEAKRGHNYQYWNDEKHDKLLQNGWQLYSFPVNRNGKTTESNSTMSEYSANETKQSLITDGYLAIIVCGYDKNIQRIKTFSILYRLRPTNVLKLK